MLNKTLERYTAITEEKLGQIVKQESDLLQNTVFDSMRYSLFSGGKRIRPALVLGFCSALGGDEKKALPFAAAIELIHTYSLIHDDLPCMDDDDMRRGRPTNHVVYGEATAVLAGDGLLNRAYEAVFSEETVELVGAKTAIEAGRVLAGAAGVYGMIGGQIIDMENEGKESSAETVNRLNELKTGALIKAAAVMGCIAAGANETQIKAAELYASCIGQAFQIIDDILDVVGDAEVFGKPIGSDADNNKTNYVTLYGLEKAREMAFELTQKAKNTLDVFEKPQFLAELADMLYERNK